MFLNLAILELLLWFIENHAYEHLLTKLFVESSLKTADSNLITISSHSLVVAVDYVESELSFADLVITSDYFDQVLVVWLHLDNVHKVRVQTRNKINSVDVEQEIKVNSPVFSLEFVSQLLDVARHIVIAMVEHSHVEKRAH